MPFREEVFEKIKKKRVSPAQCVEVNIPSHDQSGSNVLSFGLFSEDPEIVNKHVYLGQDVGVVFKEKDILHETNVYSKFLFQRYGIRPSVVMGEGGYAINRAYAASVNYELNYDQAVRIFRLHGKAADFSKVSFLPLLTMQISLFDFHDHKKLYSVNHSPENYMFCDEELQYKIEWHVKAGWKSFNSREWYREFKPHQHYLKDVFWGYSHVSVLLRAYTVARLIDYVAQHKSELQDKPFFKGVDIDKKVDELKKQVLEAVDTVEVNESGYKKYLASFRFPFIAKAIKKLESLFYFSKYAWEILRTRLSQTDTEGSIVSQTFPLLKLIFGLNAFNVLWARKNYIRSFLKYFSGYCHLSFYYGIYQQIKRNNEEAFADCLRGSKECFITKEEESVVGDITFIFWILGISLIVGIAAEGAPALAGAAFLGVIGWLALPMPMSFLDKKFVVKMMRVWCGTLTQNLVLCAGLYLTVLTVVYQVVFLPVTVFRLLWFKALPNHAFRWENAPKLGILNTIKLHVFCYGGWLDYGLSIVEIFLFMSLPGVSVLGIPGVAGSLRWFAMGIAFAWAISVCKLYYFIGISFKHYVGEKLGAGVKVLSARRLLERASEIVSGSGKTSDSSAVSRMVTSVSSLGIGGS